MTAQLTILGCGSAKPTKSNQPSSQVLEMRDKQFLIDCGEGAQIRLQQLAIRTARLNNIFISHLHGDHCFGLIGLLSTWGMLGRTRDITIHAHKDLERLMRPLLDYFCEGMLYDVKFNHIDPYKHQKIYDDKSLTVTTLPLKHRVPCCGFLFEEKEREPHIIREMIDAYEIPLSEIPRIKAGADFLTADGRLIKNQYLTSPADKPYRYAYCSDTAYNERLIEMIEGVDCLYHEATYTNDFAVRAKETMHSTAHQAATIAKKAQVGQLIIGHFSARIDDTTTLLREAQEVFPNTQLAQERKTIILQK